MISRNIAVFCLFVGFFASKAQAQSGSPMWEGRRSHSEATLYIREGCPETDGHYANCAQLREQYAQVDPLGVPADTSIAAFANYFASLQQRTCPSYMTLYWLNQQGELRNDYQRAAKPGEQCLFNSQTNRWVVSLWCGNGINSPQPTVPVSVSGERAVGRMPPPSPPAPPPIPQNAPQPQGDTVSISKIVVEVYVKGKVDSIVVTSPDGMVQMIDRGQGLITVDHTAAYFKTYEEMRKSNSLVPVLTHAGAALVGGLVGYFLSPQQTQNVTVNDPNRCGGPVNPPNAPSFGIMKALGEPSFVKRERLLKVGFMISF